jgi:hypothetical protein
VQSLGGGNSYPVHLGLPVSLHGGVADLRISVTIVGLNKFRTTSAAGDGDWTCAALTPMAGAGKTAVLSCALDGAQPGSALRLGLDIGYAGDASVDAVLDVVAPTLDSTSGDNTASAALPPRNLDGSAP